jgi:hypothetical protein
VRYIQKSDINLPVFILLFCLLCRSSVSLASQNTAIEESNVGEDTSSIIEHNQGVCVSENENQNTSATENEVIHR